ncbi:MAG: alpha-1,2-fucosyltransferase [Candidatus Amulumruptor caecigallinarius]|nr:alpha-1,2-fucosyltransferase [Candidatus Amulumruptor caecigallinarius]
MIYARDKGQMCNNILQFGHVYAFAREHGRNCISMRFCYKYPFFKIRGGKHNPFRYAYAKAAAALGLFPIVAYNTPGEVSPEKQNTILSHKNVIVEGWEVRFYDLFLKYRSEIRNLFNFKAKVRRNVDLMMSDSEDCVRIGLHVRRGDYIRWQCGKYYFSDSQYISVARKLSLYAGNRYPGKKIVFYVCGNDPSLSREDFRNGLNGCDVKFPAGNPGEDLYALSKCNLLAGPPSTFSLMAAFYEDLPLYWIKNPDAEINSESFGRFESLFRQII